MNRLFFLLAFLAFVNANVDERFDPKNFPNVDFVEDFVKQHALTGTVLHAPNNTDKSGLVRFRKQFK